MAEVIVIKTDITELHVDAIVNAANNSLLGGGGVDGAIHRAAGSELLTACKALNGCKTGAAKITKGFNLPAKYIIHTVGPVYANHSPKEAERLLSSTYYNSLELTLINNIKTIAFPNISTGVYGFPKNKAAEIAIKAVHAYLKNHHHINKVVFCCFDDENLHIYKNILQ